MTEQDIAEQAYKNGYEQGYADGKKDAALEEQVRLTAEDVAQINRALGTLEGLSYAVDAAFSEGIMDAVGMIDDLLEKEGQGKCRTTTG